jgi:hypothetical protein
VVGPSRPPHPSTPAGDRAAVDRDDAQPGYTGASYLEGSCIVSPGTC